MIIHSADDNNNEKSEVRSSKEAVFGGCRSRLDYDSRVTSSKHRRISRYEAIRLILAICAVLLLVGGAVLLGLGAL